MKNAITVGLEMKARGEHLAGIRIDSGDLAWNAKKARAMLDGRPFTDTGVVLSNDLDEFAIKSIRDSGAKVASWGVGTRWLPLTISQRAWRRIQTGGKAHEGWRMGTLCQSYGAEFQANCSRNS